MHISLVSYKLSCATTDVSMLDNFSQLRWLWIPSQLMHSLIVLTLLFCFFADLGYQRYVFVE